MKASKLSLVAVVILMISAPAQGQFLSVDNAEVVDANGTRVGRVQSPSNQPLVFVEVDGRIFGLEIVPDQLKELRKPRLVLPWIRWMLFGAMFCALCWALFLRPAEVLQIVPKLDFFSLSSEQTVADVLPPHPDTMSQAWDLSQIEAQIRLTEYGQVVVE